MNLLFILGVVFSVAIIAAAHFAPKRRLFAIPLFGFTALMLLGCWYAYAESESVMWTIIYGLLALDGIVVGVFHLVGKGLEDIPWSDGNQAP